jgi:hypothetical protein
VVEMVEQQPSALGRLPDGTLAVGSIKDHLFRDSPTAACPRWPISPNIATVTSTIWSTSSAMSSSGLQLRSHVRCGTTRDASQAVDPDGAIAVAAEGLNFPTAR